MDMYPQFKSVLGYQNGKDKIDSYGVDHSNFSLQDEIEYQTARAERENTLINQYNKQGITNNYPQFGTNFWGNSSNNYGFGTSNIADNINAVLNQINTLIPEKNTVNYSLDGNDFSKEYIDKMLADKEFNNILNEYIIPNEGGYANDRLDPGGETNMGISKNYFPNENIKNLTRERANALYYRNFYNWNGLNKLPYQVKGFVVDYGILTGQQNAINTVHKILNNPTNANIIGPITIEKFKNFSDYDYAKFLENYKTEMIKHFKQTIEQNPDKQKYLNGWISRANRAHLAK